MDIKAHPFFAELDFVALVVCWQRLLAVHVTCGIFMLRDQNRAITAPWVPPLRDSLDVSNFDEYPEEDEVRACVRARVVHGVGGGGGGDPCLAHRWSRTVTTGLAGMLLFRVCVYWES